MKKLMRIFFTSRIADFANFALFVDIDPMNLWWADPRQKKKKEDYIGSRNWCVKKKGTVRVIGAGMWIYN